MEHEQPPTPPSTVKDDFGIAPTAGKKTLQASDAPSSGACAPGLAPDAIKRAARHAVNYANQKYRLEGIVDGSDLTRAEKECANLLAWKLGDTTSACNDVTRLSVGQLGQAYGDEAAAILLELVSMPGSGDPAIYVPLILIENHRPKRQTEPMQAAPSLIAAMGLPRDSEALVASYLATKVDDPNGKSLKLPYSRDAKIEARLVQNMVDELRKSQ